jgi:hypothetical protein
LPELNRIALTVAQAGKATISVMLLVHFDSDARARSCPAIASRSRTRKLTIHICFESPKESVASGNGLTALPLAAGPALRSSMVLALLRSGLETIGLAQTRPARRRTGPNASHSSHVISLLDIAKAQHPLGISP